jgi:hypothetical protein
LIHFRTPWVSRAFFLWGFITFLLAEKKSDAKEKHVTGQRFSLGYLSLHPKIEDFGDPGFPKER